MTREEAIRILYVYSAVYLVDASHREAFDMAIKALEQETVSKESYDHEYFLRKELEMKIAKLERQEPFINKPCVSSGVCEHDKNAVLDKLRDEISFKQEIQLKSEDESEWNKCISEVLEIIDKYKGNKEDIENE